MTGHPRFHSYELKSRAVRMYVKAGLSSQQVADKLGISNQAVITWVRASDPKAVRPRGRVPGAIVTTTPTPTPTSATPTAPKKGGRGKGRTTTSPYPRATPASANGKYAHTRLPRASRKGKYYISVPGKKPFRSDPSRSLSADEIAAALLGVLLRVLK